MRRRNLKPSGDEAVGAIQQDSASFVSDELRADAVSEGVLPRSAAASDLVEAALARALDRASEASRFDVVAQLAKELESRRLARTPNVVRLDDQRAKQEPEK